MEKQTNWQYSSEKTKLHPISQKFPSCVKKIKDIVVIEGGSNPSFANEVAVNLDNVEKILAKQQGRNLQKTMDMFFCIMSGKLVNTVLSELRFNYTNYRNISFTEINGKVGYSSELVASNFPIHKTYYLIFPSKIKEQANDFIRRNNSIKSTYIALDIKDLKELFFTSGN